MAPAGSSSSARARFLRAVDRSLFLQPDIAWAVPLLAHSERAPQNDRHVVSLVEMHRKSVAGGYLHREHRRVVLAVAEEEPCEPRAILHDGEVGIVEVGLVSSARCSLHRR